MTQICHSIVARHLVCVVTACLLPALAAWGATDKELFDSACAACHGPDGASRPQEEVGFETPPADFTDCRFTSREQDPDWFAIVHEGGPVRAFDRMMPAFGDALSAEEIHAVLRAVRSFCTDARWPRGEFNLPRALFTEKAFPEDEAVATMTYDTGDGAAWEMELTYEKRIGPRAMIEVALPLAFTDPPGMQGGSGIGDMAVAYKYNFYNNLDSGNIISAGVEGVLPTGSEDEGLGKGTAVIEPFIAWGKILPDDMFLQAHLFAEFPTESEFDNEMGLRMAFGRSFAANRGFGRSWTPMIEVLAARDLVAGAETNIDLVPQLQVTLSTRQHIMVSFGVSVPANHTEGRDPVIGAYLLWDWFDGGFFDGW